VTQETRIPTDVLVIGRAPAAGNALRTTAPSTQTAVERARQHPQLGRPAMGRLHSRAGSLLS